MTRFSLTVKPYPGDKEVLVRIYDEGQLRAAFLAPAKEKAWVPAGPKPGPREDAAEEDIWDR